MEIEENKKLHYTRTYFDPPSWCNPIDPDFSKESRDWDMPGTTSEELSAIRAYEDGKKYDHKGTE